MHIYIYIERERARGYIVIIIVVNISVISSIIIMIRRIIMGIVGGGPGCFENGRGYPLSPYISRSANNYEDSADPAETPQAKKTQKESTDPMHEVKSSVKAIYTLVAEESMQLHV